MIETSRQGTVTVFQTDERFNSDHVTELREVADSRLKTGVPLAVFNLESTQIINSAGLEFLLDFGDLLRSRGGDLKLAAPNSLCREILEITGCDSQLEIFDNVNQAVRSFVK